MESCFAWTQELDERLVELWAENDCLYAVSNPLYADRDARIKATETMATLLGCTGMCSSFSLFN